MFILHTKYILFNNTNFITFNNNFDRQRKCINLFNIFKNYIKFEC